jgi:hypothetical protein
VSPALLLTLAALSAAPSTSTLELRRFQVVYTPRAAGAAELLSRTLEPARDELARRLGRDWEGRTLVLVGEGPEELAALAPQGVQPPGWAAGMAFPDSNTLLLDARPLRGSDGRPLLLHELAHLGLARAAPGVWPRWFHEGFAMLVAGEWSIGRYAAIYRASIPEAAIPLSALAHAWPDRHSEVEVAYAESLSFVSYLYEERGEQAFRDLISAVASGQSFESAFSAAYGSGLEPLEAAWRKSISSHYSWVPILTGTGTLWVVAALAVLIGFFTARKRRRARLEQMELEELARDAAMRIVAAEQKSPFDPENDEEDDDEDGEEPPDGSSPPTGPLM